MRAPGRFISLEGIEGAGKSTLMRALEAELRARGLAVLCTREPGGTPLAERLRAVLLERDDEPMPAVAETLLMFAARSLHWHHCIRPALAGGSWVLCDRFTDATRAYQGAGRGISRELIETLAGAAHEHVEPDRTLLLDLPVDLGLQRARQRVEGSGARADRFEQEAQAFFERVRAGYLTLAGSEPTRVRLIDASGRPQAVLAAAMAAIADLLAPQRAAPERA